MTVRVSLDSAVRPCVRFNAGGRIRLELGRTGIGVTMTRATALALADAIVDTVERSRKNNRNTH
ncbi:hypothetical protein [Rhodococcus sp. B10]|uniref:hypothetical protein n=1 Tax=Rhodococcus sp. B10 TaxID=2695876 RepID=UPI001430B50D|nr:hypothetical protein [Rhodococcus sp. B10]NIL74416.1 hypothetical protein [Rhodococcus sp. B10]